jgi:hypothetical protein
MKTRKTVLSLALGLLTVAVCVAGDSYMGTWKLNEAKSKIPAGAPKNNTVVYVQAGDSIKVTVDGVDGMGKPAHNEWTGKFDGKDYPLMGDPQSDTRSYKKIDDHTTELVNKKGGKPTLTARIVIAADGKSRTVTATGVDAKGNKIEVVAVYDKQ